jgi:hypothetical protein
MVIRVIGGNSSDASEELMVTPLMYIRGVFIKSPIQLSMEMSMAFYISKEKTTKDMMDALDKLYENPSMSNKVFLMKRLFNMKMSEDGSVANHLNEFSMVTNQLISVKVDFDDEVGALLILCSLPETWNDLVMNVSNSVSSSNTLKFDDVVGVILSDEMR